MSKRRVKITVTGKVQGVFFRHESAQLARRHQLGGLVCNLPDGSVYLEAEGEAEKIEQLIQWCQTGPELAEVSSVQVSDIPLKGRRQFEIR